MELGVLEVCETSRVKVNELAIQLAREHDRIFETEEDDIAEQKKIVEYTEKIKVLREFLQSEKLPGSVVTKIPQVDLKFTGSPKDWRLFKSMYEATVSSHNLSVIEQFLILVNALPIQLRRNLPTEPTRENLSWILKHLTDRYGDDETRILREIRDLKFSRTAFSAYVDRLTGLWIQAKESGMPLEVASITIQTQLWENLPRNIAILLKSEESNWRKHQTNGLIERANRTIESMIRTTAVDKTNWDTILNKMISAYNASVHHSTKLAPFKTMFGHDMVTPLDLQFGIEFRDTNWDTLKIARIEATSQMQNRQKEQYDKRAKQEEIAVGDLVLWHQVDQTARSSKKLNQRWRGPYKVVAREATNCKITDRRGTCRVIHQNHLKLFKGPSELDVIRNRGRPARSADPAGEVQHRER
ncbi:UNVERIFIED_CONTAM: hypothetical protein PYX00_002308 [Menopon gallinae]|uniref:Integrase catalytic domain-containing protein n=1 Tax=Menopon gallinae TaxID=328185 RepID=A0AAW2IH95_9NEOP